MALKLNVGVTRKIGETNFGSRGASMSVEMEIDSSLISDSAKLQDRIRGLFDFVRHAVDEELDGRNGPRVGTQEARPDPPKLSGPDRRANENGAPRGGVRPATPSQVKAICNIARYRKLDLAAFLQDRFNVDRVEDLSLKQASQAIDDLKAEKPR